MSIELEKILHRMKVTLKAVEQPSTPARGFTTDLREWRITLSRENRGEEKPQKLTLTLLSTNEPTMTVVVETIAQDIEDSEMSLWDFAQEYNKGKTTANVELMHKTCRRTVPRVHKFFGDSWAKLIKTLDMTT